MTLNRLNALLADDSIMHGNARLNIIMFLNKIYICKLELPSTNHEAYRSRWISFASVAQLVERGTSSIIR